MNPTEPLPFFSVIIPAHNEEGNIERTCRAIAGEFHTRQVADFEILVVNDNSRDATLAILESLQGEIPELRIVNNTPPNGFGFAIRAGLAQYRGQCACIVMGDLSDAPSDIYAYYQQMKNGAECVFGSRFIHGSALIDYPRHKLFLNRLVNVVIRMLFRIQHNDITNAFKCYRRDVIDGIQPILSPHFNLTVELPLKAIVRGYTYVTLPISWTNRTSGKSNLRIKEMGSRYLFIILYVFLEKLLAKGDYKRRSASAPGQG